MRILKFNDFRVAGTWLAFACIWALAIPAMDARAADDSATPTISAQATSSTSVQNIQRLLTLLSERYPTKYGAVNPGRVDGSLGASTRNAIRKFQQISGIKPGSQNNDQLIADILSTLALVSAQQPEESGTAANAPQPAPKAAAESVKNTTNTVDAVPPAAETPALEASIATRPASEKAATAVPAARYAAPHPPAKRAMNETAQAERPSPSPAPAPRVGDRIYFVQAASLRSLAAAKREWQQIFSNNRIALTGEQVFFEEADIAGRGTYFRILIGPMNERSAAQTLCDFLKQNEQACVVTERNPEDLEKPKLHKGALTPETAPKAGGGDAGKKALAEADAPAADPPGKEARAPPMTTLQGAPESPVESPAAPVAAERVPRQQPEAKTTGAAETPQEPASTPMAPPQDPGTVGAKTDPSPRATATPSPPAPPAPVEIGKAESSAPAAMPASPTTTPRAPDGNVSTAPANTAGASSQAGAPIPAPASPQADGGSAATPQPIETAAATDRTAPTSRQSRQPGSAIANFLKIAPGVGQPLGIAVGTVLVATLLLFIWRRRSQRDALAQFVRPADFLFSRPVPATSQPPDAMTSLETDFESDTLRRSRDDRDAFLRDILGEEIDVNGDASKEDQAIRINSSLKQLLASDPALYKSIFLNLIFLSKVGAALNRKDITIESVNGHFRREFKLLQNYFKIHILELDDRHSIRKELPGLFYCLQLAQQRQRPVHHHVAT